MTRSIGAAAVFETAAETPPTVIASQYVSIEITRKMKLSPIWSKTACLQSDEVVEGRRTQEIDNEALSERIELVMHLVKIQIGINSSPNELAMRH